MTNVKIGDIVDMCDDSWCFGIEAGEFSTSCDWGKGSRNNLTVIETGLRAMRDATDDRSGEYTAVCDILVIDDNGNFWFTQSRFVELHKHTIVVDDKTIEISRESYIALKQSLRDD